MSVNSWEKKFYSEVDVNDAARELNWAKCRLNCQGFIPKFYRMRVTFLFLFSSIISSPVLLYIYTYCTKLT